MSAQTCDVCMCALCAGHMKVHVQLACQASRLQPSACLMDNWTASIHVMVTTLQWMGPPLPSNLYKVISQSKEGGTSAEIAAILHDLVQIPLSTSAHRTVPPELVTCVHRSASRRWVMRQSLVLTRPQCRSCDILCSPDLS